MTTPESAYRVLLTCCVMALAILIILSIIRSVLGPRIADRIIAVNMVGTMTIIISILSVYLDENYLVDVSLIYAMISFLTVIVLCKVYIGVYREKHNIPSNTCEGLSSHRRKGGLTWPGNGVNSLLLHFF